MKGFKDSDGKFRPISNTKSSRKKLDKTIQTDGVRMKKLVGKPKQTGVFSIGAGGLKPIMTNIIPLEVGGAYWLGASSSPNHIIITGLNDSFITYRSYPYGKDIRIERDIGEDLIRKGLTNRLKTIQNSPFEGFKDDINRFILLLDSDDDGVKIVNFQDLQPVSVKVDLVRQPKDHDEDDQFWRHAETFGGVGGIGFADDDANSRRTKGYSIHTSRGQLNEIKNDPLFKNFKITEDKYKGE